MTASPARTAPIYTRRSLERLAEVRPSSGGDGVHFVDRYTFDPPGSTQTRHLGKATAPSLQAAVEAADGWIGTCRHCGHALLWSPTDDLAE